MAKRINRMAFTRGDGLYAPGINRSLGGAHGKFAYDGEGISDWLSAIPRLLGFGGAKAVARPSSAHWLSHFAGGRIRKGKRGGLVSRTWNPKKVPGIDKPPFNMQAGRIRRHKSKSKRRRGRGIYA